jgi:CheY-like chemotaxis protein
MRQLRWRGVPAIALSGYGSEEDVRESQEAGFALHLTKPVEISKLEEAIRQVVQTQGARPVPLMRSDAAADPQTFAGSLEECTFPKAPVASDP